jgi:hypothetical protein
MNWKHAPLHALLGLLFIGLAAFVLGRLSINALLFVSIAALAGLTLVGIFVSLHPDRQWLIQRRGVLGLIFAALGAVGAVVVTIQGFRENQNFAGFQGQLAETSTRARALEAELERAKADAFKAQAELDRERSLNVELQKKLLEQSTQLKELAIERVKEASGGDSFAYLDLAPGGPAAGVELQAVAQGEYPVRQVRYRVGDGGGLVEVGDLAPKSRRAVDTALYPQESGSSYKITILAANGPIQQNMDVRFNTAAKRWERRVRVVRDGSVVMQRDWGR